VAPGEHAHGRAFTTDAPTTVEVRRGRPGLSAGAHVSPL
jgi:hypothetical protein